MFRITKVLNHNTVLAVKDKSTQEYLIVGKGIGFGKKVTQTVEMSPEYSLYAVSQTRDRGLAKDIVKSIEPEFLEIANTLLDEAEKEFGKIDRSILFSMADHIAFAVKRIKNNEQISNPLNDDIRVLFYKEYKIAEKVRPILKEKINVDVIDDEIGYITLHIHTAIDDSKVSDAMQMAQAVRTCAQFIEDKIGITIDVTTMAYNRLMNHIRSMVARAVTGEMLKVDLNRFIEQNYPDSFSLAKEICMKLGHELKHGFSENEVGYLAVHIEQIKCDEMLGEK